MTSTFSPLSQQLRGIHHVGLTVEDMGKALEFYTEVLGGKIIIPEIGLDGEIMHNTLLQKEEIEAIEKGIDPKSIGIPNLRDGEEKLDLYFIQFENVVLEILQYRDCNASPNGAVAFPAKNSHSSPAFINSMHISFYLKDDVDVDQFVRNLEAECHQRGMDQVRCNRIMRVYSESERTQTPVEANSCKLFDPSFGDFEGWTLVYCKGPNGEQLEFNQVLRKAKVLFETAQNNFVNNHEKTDQLLSKSIR
ncbi:VOC family protein [Gloeocapsa sp. PCC 73106]|uniref:VOC family protein n=1 Tax=Gloeocapsa sp. PCC 73106 TaxID=102232 RepID=UPI0002ACF21A|nr:VOC family protein [Gloeocapsa sp. PCC 73106]ELR97554.1 lactoylglutathione lyase-like lyase [Gloeocapsa sp. PCC 73106]